MTESYDKRYHLQSYFVLYHERALSAPAFRAFWADLPYVDSRGWLIHLGEVALTQSLIRAGLRVRALFPYAAIIDVVREDLAASPSSRDDAALPDGAGLRRQFRARIAHDLDAGKPLNPTHFFWDLLIEKMGFPFLKRDLLLRNRAELPALSSWRHLVGRVSRYDVQQIERDLQGSLRNRIV